MAITLNISSAVGRFALPIAQQGFVAQAGNFDRLTPPQAKKKADMAEHPKVFDHVGLLYNEPSSDAGVLFI